MLDYLNIKNYRFFTELNVPKLSRVNLEKITLGKAHSSKDISSCKWIQRNTSIHKVLSDREESQ